MAQLPDAPKRRQSPKSLANLKRGGSPGRTKGVPNKVTRIARDIAQRIVDDPVYLAKLTERARRGRIQPAVEVMLWHYAYGTPKTQVEVNGTLEGISRFIIEDRYTGVAPRERTA